MKRFYLSVCCTILIAGLFNEALGQKRTDRGADDNKSSTRAPKRTDRALPESERVKVITKTEFVKVVVRPNKGYLSVVAIAGAHVTLTPIPVGRKKAAAIKEVVKNEDGSLNLINLLPGKYKIAIEHENYQPFSSAIQVDPARPDTFVALNRMVSRYGEIHIGGVPADAKILLDGSAIKTSSLEQENQSAVIRKVPVGKHRLVVSKEGYVDFAKEIDLQPGEQNFVSARLDLARVTINLTSQPGARVYVGSKQEAIIPSDGSVTISLAPGQHTIRLTKDGYQEWRKDLALSLANNPVTERVELIPIPNSAEGAWGPLDGQGKWHPPASGWRFDASGALIRNDKLVLFDTEQSRDFNIYRNFKLEFDVVFSNGKGVVWAARAKDPNNYYLFEISGPQTAAPTFHFYVCQGGKLELKDSQRIVEKMDKPGDSFHIIFEARDNRFETRMTIASAPSSNPHLIGIFQDDSFSYGGIGFRGKDLSQSLLQTFFVIPLR
jgi:hypothetical protein